MPPIRRKTQTEEERLADRARVDAQMNRQSIAMSNAARAKTTATAQAVEEDPNTPSRRRREEMAKRAPTGYQLMLQALGWGGMKKKK